MATSIPTWIPVGVPGKRSDLSSSNDCSQPENSTDTVVDSAGQSRWQLAHSVAQPGPIDQLQSKRHRDRCRRQSGHGGLKHDIARESSPIKV